MHRAAVAMGSNLGDRIATLRGAVAELRRSGTVVAASSLYETAPVGGPSQGEYLNAVVVVETDLGPDDLLCRLLSIEEEAGRTRDVRWGPRTLDLDLIAMTDGTGRPLTRDSPRLTLPHPRARERRFVLQPLSEVWAEAPLGSDVSLDAALAAVSNQEVRRVSGPTWSRGGRMPQGRAASVAYLAVQSVLMGAFALAFAASVDHRRPVHPWALAVAGAGTVLAAASVSALGGSMSPFPEPVPGGQVVERGPYRMMRHPIYSGIVLALAGVAVAFAAWWALVIDVVLGVLFSFKARYEERRLLAEPNGYDDYMRRVGGRLVPWPSRRAG